MRVRLACVVCMKVPGRKSLRFEMAELDDRGLYQLTCEAGHSVSFCLQNFNFELLFELGCHAIVDGYYREAVSSFASALERLYEFYVETICEAAGTSAVVFQASWKKVANQSERQLGAYLFTYAREENAEAPTLSEKDVKFRNGVVHKGRFPPLGETMESRNRVWEIMHSILLRLRSAHGSVVEKLVHRQVARAQALAPAGSEIVSLLQGTLVTVLESPDSSADFGGYVTALRSARR